ncbi:hypothetical protein [Apibacter sp. HY039]|uniref:hypothetical protein n=1 Tax=Apibacter sp. HY039 TaxID=2501476 RepID=UPI000FEB909C|nr:hypothetical protein [Apibacter sp. HY039]
MDSLPENVSFKVAVRVNSSRKNDSIFKFTGFDCSGILYVYGEIIYFKGSKPGYEQIEFDLKSAVINWVGVQAQNGALQWFSIKNNQDTYYFNMETGITIFNLSKSGESTRNIYEKLKNFQAATNLEKIGAQN